VSRWGLKNGRLCEYGGVVEWRDAKKGGEGGGVGGGEEVSA